MSRKFLIVFLALVLCLSVATGTMAAAKPKAKKTLDNVGLGWYYIEGAGTGFSVNYPMNDTMSVQAILCPFGWPGFYGGNLNP